jgi:PHP family Zn ribbon phosphoesterase
LNLRVIADLHIHGRFSRATSERMSIPEIARFSRIKGLNLVGTGDFTHPKWLKEIRETLTAEQDTGLFRLSGNADSPVRFMLTTEVCTIFNFKGDSKKVHHVILTPSIENVVQINEMLQRYGNLASDGRPILNMTAPQLVEEVMTVSSENMIFPAHAWTPWFSIFGAFSGFDNMEDCYQDMTKHIHALETGLSCYDKETQVLTVEGWKNFDELNYDDEICTLKIDTNEIEFQKPLKLHSYQHKGRMYRLKTKRVDLLVTPDHKLLYSPCDFRRLPKLILRKAELMFNKSKRFKKNGIWKGEDPEYFILPEVKVKHGSQYYSGSRIQKEKKLPLKAWLRFFGFWVAEGWTTEGKEGDYNVCVSNKNSLLLSEMQVILQDFGYCTYLSEKTFTLRVRDYQLFHYLKKFSKCSQKFVPKEIKALSKENLELFFEYYIKGDGHIYGRSGKGLSATTTSARLRDDLQEIALKLGISAYFKLGKRKGTTFRSPSSCFKKKYKQREDTWIIYFIRKNLHAVLPSTNKKYNYDESWIDFEGPVFCVTVPNHVIYIRRNGIPVWCGNSDPPMNWRLSGLDSFALVSNSDCHSFWPWRIGREANVFDLEKFTYQDVAAAIKNNDPVHFRFTIETDPAYGKYHWTGHRNCKVSLSPKDAIKFNNICPVCRRKLTKGVEQRIEELTDRPMNFKREDAPGFLRLLPLSEIIATVLGTDSPSTQAVWKIYNSLIEKFHDEYTVLIDTPMENLAEVTDTAIAEAIGKVRNGKVRVTPGYDGVYGQLVLNVDATTAKPEAVHGAVKQSNIADFW